MWKTEYEKGKKREKSVCHSRLSATPELEIVLNFDYNFQLKYSQKFKN